MTKRILIGSPCKNGFSVEYMESMMQFRGLPSLGYEVEFVGAAGGSVNMARNKLANQAIAGNFDELLQLDSDIRWTNDHIIRLLSHDVDVVAGVYPKRQGGQPVYLFAPKPGAEKQPNGLMECAGVATGFLRTKVSVLRKICADNPHLEHRVSDKHGNPKNYFELFPMGVVGPRTPEARLEEVKAILAKMPPFENPKAFIPAKSITEIREAIFGERDVGCFLGEDYYFSRLCRRSGFTVWADIGGNMLGHQGEICYPVTPEMVGMGPGVEQKLPDPAVF